jgi:hypothetical protein
MLTCSSSAQYARCSLENELFVTRALFPEVPEGIEDQLPINLRVLEAAEQAKSNAVAQRAKARARSAEILAAEDDTNIEIPLAAQEDWEEDYHFYLTEQFQQAGLSNSDIHYLFLRYGEYLIEHRVTFGPRPSAADIQRE